MKILKFILKAFLALFVVYGIVGIFILPNIVTTQIIENTQKQLNRTVSLDSVSINPYSFEIDINKLSIRSKNDKEDFITISKVSLNVDPLNMISGEIKIDFIELTSPFVRIHKKKDGVFNFADLLSSETKKETKKEKTTLPNIILRKFAIKRAKINFIDETGSKVFNETLSPINFTIRDFSTAKDHNNLLSLNIKLTDGAFIEYRGKVNSIEPLKLEGGMKIHSGRLYSQWKYVQDKLGFIVADGAMDASFDYTANLSSEPMQVNINQYQLTIKDLRLQDKKTKADVLKLPSLALNGDADLIGQNINLNNFKVKGFSLKAIRDKDGIINWLSYFPKSENEADANTSQEPSPWKINIANVDIKTNDISFEENYVQEPYIAGFKEFYLALNDIKIDPKYLTINSFTTSLTDTYLKEIKGKEVFKMPLLSLNGKADIKNKNISLDKLILKDIELQAVKDKLAKLNFEKYAPKAEAKKKETSKNEWRVGLNSFNLNTKKVSFRDNSAINSFDVGLDRVDFRMHNILLDGDNLHVEKFKTKLSNIYVKALNEKRKIVSLKNIIINGKIDKTKSTDINLKTVDVNNMDIFALMDENGIINFSNLQPKNKIESPKQIDKKETKLNWKIEKLSLNKSNIDFQDRFNAKDTTTKIKKLNLHVENLSSKKGSWAKTRLSMSINDKAKLTVNTRLRQSPLKVKGDIRLKGLEFKKFQEYADKKVNMDINSGVFNLDFKLDHDDKSTKILANTQVFDLNLSERKENKTFFSFKKLLIKDIDFSLNPVQLKIENIDIYEPYARMKVEKDKKTNIDNLVIQESNSSVSDTNTSTKKAFAVFIAKVNFKNGTGSFTDLSLPLPFSTKVHSLNGQMLALGTITDIPTSVDIDGAVDEYGLMKIKGKLLSANPKKLTDMSVKFQNIDMTNLSPYTGKFIGYKLEKGKMNVELDYKINDSMMNGGNRIILKKMTLGEEVESEDAISAPVGLAIALLKDGDGVIDLDVPVEGDVDNPDFKIGKVVWTAFKNLITSVATAPFRFLGNMLGMSAEELENVEFEVGKSKLLPPQREKLDKLYTALSEKDMLILKVAGSYDTKRDLLAMKTAKLWEEALAKLDDKTVDITKMDRDDLDDLIKQMYVAHFKEEKLDKIEKLIDKKEIDSDAKKLILREQMKKDLIEDQKVSKIDLINLAKTRASVVVTYLQTKGISQDRLSVLDSVSIEITKEENEYIPSKLELGAK